MKKQSLKNSHETVFSLFGSPRKIDFLPPAARKSALEKRPRFALPCSPLHIGGRKRTMKSPFFSFLFVSFPLCSFLFLSFPLFSSFFPPPLSSPCLFPSAIPSLRKLPNGRNDLPLFPVRCVRGARPPSFTALSARVSCRNRRIAHIRDWRYRVFSFCPRSCRKSARIPKTK